MADAAAVDASPLIYLARAELLDLLRLAARRIVVPHPVLEELQRGPADNPAATQVAERWWLEVVEPLEERPEVARCGLGPGESAVLSWCRHTRGSAAIVDDLAARRCAADLSIPYRGTLGLVLVAKQRGVVPAARPILENLRDHGMYLSRRTMNTALSRVGE